MEVSVLEKALRGARRIYAKSGGESNDLPVRRVRQFTQDSRSGLPRGHPEQALQGRQSNWLDGAIHNDQYLIRIAQEEKR